MTGYSVKHRSAQEIEIAELRNSLAQAKQKKTLRDEFAMAVLSGASHNIYPHKIDVVVEKAYQLADAMMKERIK
jgi:hypothetical protein